MKKRIFKKTIIASALCLISLFFVRMNALAQNQILGFKNAEKQNKIEKDFDAQ